MGTRMTHEARLFFSTMKRAEQERLERFHGEERKRFILRCASGGGMRHEKTRNPPVSLPKMSWDEK